MGSCQEVIGQNLRLNVKQPSCPWKVYLVSLNGPLNRPFVSSRSNLTGKLRRFCFWRNARLGVELRPSIFNSILTLFPLGLKYVFLYVNQPISCTEQKLQIRKAISRWMWFLGGVLILKKVYWWRRGTTPTHLWDLRQLSWFILIMHNRWGKWFK